MRLRITREFLFRITELADELAANHATGARLCQPVLGPASDLWELWFDVPARLLADSASTDSVLWKLTDLALDDSAEESRSTLELVEGGAPLYRVWCFSSPSAASASSAPTSDVQA